MKSATRWILGSALALSGSFSFAQDDCTPVTTVWTCKIRCSAMFAVSGGSTRAEAYLKLLERFENGNNEQFFKGDCNLFDQSQVICEQRF